MNSGKLIKSVGGIFYVADGEKVLPCRIRKKLRYNDNELLIGDNIEYGVDEFGQAVIENVCERKNSLTRPSVANIDLAVIIVASKPQPDFLLVDKIILNCYLQNIEPVIVLNKTDINDKGFNEMVCEGYKNTAADIVSISALSGLNMDCLSDIIKGKSAVFCGQSAVGKTSILNQLSGEAYAVGSLSVKSGRGKHTTRHSQIFSLKDNTFVVDTPGFSLLELQNIKSQELNLFYTDMIELQKKCKYHMCTHTMEPDCEVKRAVENGSFDKMRYFRYLDIFADLKTTEKNKF